ncbi:sulfatase [Microbacterium sp. MYb64]|uniref:sulfatase n=1 Tax=Microbacterium sp. MYb64 TaxID=1848691 RepID=UPI000CFAF313|nr:sulfatase [Microbacterium sp. MYb64]PRB03444.1 sulfatase [Microbacterium sp. MYb64]
MRAVMVMFDSLNRHMLPPYGSDEIVAPNFQRLAERTVVFDRFYAGSLPCMPARRELHTGRHNFLHRSWGPLEPWDDSMPELLKKAGVHTHLASDHFHYWEDGGATYHSRYSTWEFFRGQDGDPWKGRVDTPDIPLKSFRGAVHRQDAINRGYLQRQADHPQSKTFDAGLEFIRTNASADDWFLQIECFDPHEPFFTYDEYRALYPHNYDGPDFDWPPYQRVTEPESQVEHARNEYKALVSMCDRSLGRVLDAMDEHHLWEDTLLIVNTDHGFLLGEHGWWAKSVQPWFDELVHLPAFLWDPRTKQSGVRSDALAQTIDIAPTLLRHFGIETPADMQGLPLRTEDDQAGHAPRDGALFGIYGGHVNVTDGRYVYMRACAASGNTPLEEFTLMPTHMRSRFGVNELLHAELASPFGFTKGVRPLRVAGRTLYNPFRFGTLLYDLETDPKQEKPLQDQDLELRMLRLLARLLRETDAPRSQFERLGIPWDGEPSEEHLLVGAQRDLSEAAAAPLPPRTEFAADSGVHTPIRTLLGDPAARTVVHKHLPILADTEVLGFVAGTTLYDAAATAMIPPRVLRALSAELAAL